MRNFPQFPAQVFSATPQVMLESLEERIAPASFTYFDLDGDSVKVSTSKGTDLELKAAVTLSVDTSNGTLERLDFNHDTTFAGTNVTVSVTARGATGNGLADVGLIDATGIDLGSVTIGGDIGKILAGDTNYATAGLKGIKAQSVGKYGVTTQEPAGDLDWDIEGSTGTVNILNGVDGASLLWHSTGAVSVKTISIGGDLTGKGSLAAGDGSIQILSDTSHGSIGSLKVGGSLIGSDTWARTGYIAADKVGAVTIGHDLIGAMANNTGNITINNSFTPDPAITTCMGAITIGGSIHGGDGINSGFLFGTTSIGAVKIGGSVTIGTGLGSGQVLSGGNIAGVHIGGSLSGEVTGEGLGTVTIGGDIQGGTATASGSLIGSSASSVTIGGDVLGGAGNSSGVIAVAMVKSIAIGGDVIGGTNVHTGVVTGEKLTGKFTIGGDVRGSLAGTDGVTDTGIIDFEVINALTIGGSLVGGDNHTVGTLNDSGCVLATTSLKTLVVHGNIVAGVATASSNLNSGAVRAGILGSVQVAGSLIGDATNYVTITGGGNTAAVSKANLAISKVVVNGDVSFTNIVGGYDTSGDLFDGGGAVSNGGNAQIGTISILGSFTDSSIATGVSNGGFAWANAGGDNSVLPKTSAIVASIAKMEIRGGDAATVANGIVAEQIKSLSLGGQSVSVTAVAIHQALTANAMLQLQTFV